MTPNPLLGADQLIERHLQRDCELAYCGFAIESKCAVMGTLTAVKFIVFEDNVLSLKCIR
jgi:hypothetical protein